MQAIVPFTQDLVLVGGGHAHALVLRAWGMDPLPGARLTVINPGPTAPYTGMLPGHVAGHYDRDELEIDLVRLCRHAGARLILDHAINIDQTRREVILQERDPVAYDVASIDVGITAAMDLPGFAEHGVGAKPLDVYASRWRAFLQAATRGQVPPQVAVIGGGVAGCELAMAMAFALRQAGTTPQVTVVEVGPHITGMSEMAREKTLAAMANLGVLVRTDACVVEVCADHLAIEGQSTVETRFTVGAAGAFPHPWLANTRLPLRDGFIEIERDLGVRGDRALFAVGDCSVMPKDPRPKAGVFAVRAAPILHQNLRAALGAGWRRTWHPQRNYLKLISLGGKSALAEKFGMTVSGPALWQWKDRIDRAFMDRLADLPSMTVRKPAQAARGVKEVLAAKPLCGGCGAKVGSGVLNDALAELAPPDGIVVTGPGDDAAILRRPTGEFQVITTDHLRAFIEDPRKMAEIAAVHALGDVWAMGAKPEVALTSLILPQMSPALQERTLGEITRAAERVMTAAGAQLVGGHTTLGAELTIGFTVTGTRDVMPLTVRGAQPSDVLVITRPIGSGVILAADMQGLAKGAEVTATLARMSLPQAKEAAILAQVSHAMTDVTGFGLAGHVRAIAAASGLDAEIRVQDVPTYAGARRLSARGVASTLMPLNRADVGFDETADPLLFDPQTAGGLLAAVPSDKVMEALDALEGRGHVIGTLHPGTGRVRFT